MSTIVYAVLIFWGAWIFYVSVMGLKYTRDRHRVRGREIPLPFKVLAYPAIYTFLVVDVLFNAIYGTLFFLELPKEWLFTARVSRWNDVDNWRGKLARWFCKNLLDPADPDGQHCS